MYLLRVSFPILEFRSGNFHHLFDASQMIECEIGLYPKGYVQEDLSEERLNLGTCRWDEISHYCSVHVCV